MKTALIHSFGSPGAVVLNNVDIAEPSPNEVLVQVEAASVNPLDLKMIAGDMQAIFPVKLPYAPGTDFSGVVHAVGTLVADLAVGDRVVGRCSPEAGGALGQQLVVPAEQLRTISKTMSFEQAASLPTAFGTAWQGLFDSGQLKSGQRVLIHAGAGGVGGFAVQLARNAGAYVIATASAANLDLVRSLGADEVIDYGNEDFSLLSDVDLVLDTIGGETLERSWSVLGPEGRIASLVDFSVQARNGNTGEFVFFKSAASSLSKAIELFDSGRLRVVFDSIFPLERAQSALEKVATGHAKGKVIVRMEM